MSFLWWGSLAILAVYAGVGVAGVCGRPIRKDVGGKKMTLKDALAITVVIISLGAAIVGLVIAGG